MKFRPELLAPAGNLEKLKVAVLYGADAVYFSGQQYGMRAGADNFSHVDIIEGVKFAKARRVKTYITLNAFLHDEDFQDLEDYCQFLDSIGVDAVIVSDLGVISRIQKCSKLNIHLSTQSSCLNLPTAKFWKDQGLERLVLGREVSIIDAARIKSEVGIEVELFVHGAMCMAYSGNCVISNFTAGRDSNRGGCIQSCRYNYRQVPVNSLKVLAEEKSSHVISSKDMNAVRLIPSFIDSKIDSMKIEGRMKSHYYVASVCRAYRSTVDSYINNQIDEDSLASAQKELDAIPHRDYFEASFETEASSDSTYQHRSEQARTGTHKFIGLVIDQNSDFLAIRLNSLLKPGEILEFIPFKGRPISVKADTLYNINKEQLTKARQDCVLYLPKDILPQQIDSLTVVRSAEIN